MDLTDCWVVAVDDGSWKMRAHRGLIAGVCPRLLVDLDRSSGEAKVLIRGCAQETLTAFIEFVYMGDVSEEKMVGVDGVEMQRLANEYQFDELRMWLGSLAPTKLITKTEKIDKASPAGNAMSPASSRAQSPFSESEGSSNQERRSIVLALDLGSSSVRAMAYVCEGGTMRPAPKADKSGQIVGIRKVQMCHRTQTFNIVQYMKAIYEAIDESVALLGDMSGACVRFSVCQLVLSIALFCQFGCKQFAYAIVSAICALQLRQIMFGCHRSQPARRSFQRMGSHSTVTAVASCAAHPATWIRACTPYCACVMISCRCCLGPPSLHIIACAPPIANRQGSNLHLSASRKLILHGCARMFVSVSSPSLCALAYTL